MQKFPSLTSRFKKNRIACRERSRTQKTRRQNSESRKINQTKDDFLAEKDATIKKMHQDRVAEMAQIADSGSKLEQMREQNIQTMMVESKRKQEEYNKQLEQKEKTIQQLISEKDGFF